jgi:hypothetical protein
MAREIGTYRAVTGDSNRLPEALDIAGYRAVISGAAGHSNVGVDV